MSKIYFFGLILLLCVHSFGATYTVDSNANTDNFFGYTHGDGSNTLRKCIRLANANAGADVINFNITGSTVITNSSCFGGVWMAITDPVTIDGYTQSGASAGNPVIELNGNSMGCWWALNLTTGSAGSTIRGLIIYGTNIGIRMDANTSGNTISGCWIGVNNTGNAAAPNAISEHGIKIEGSNNNLIGGSGGSIDRNIISGCSQEGIRLDNTPTSGNTINGNYIGVGLNGTTDLGNRTGILASLANRLTIGGGNANEGNVISGNSERGILLTSSDTFTIKGNIIGLGADLTTTVPNTLSGLETSASSDVGQIGGSGANERNYVSGNSVNGMRFDDCNEITIQGNYIGVAGNGTTARPNSVTGINATHCEFMTVGGTASGEGNVVSANGGHGISIWSTDSRNSVIQGNMVGVSADGLTALGNSLHGIEINENEDTQIGGTSPSARNVVSNNGQSGIMVICSPRVVVENNYAGVDATGLVNMGNGNSGIFILNSIDATIGGTTRASRNIASGNVQNGILLQGTSTGAIIKANFVGIGADGTTVIPNEQHGIVSETGANNMTVGGPTAAERNVSSGNGQFLVGGGDPDNGLVGDGIRLLGTSNHVIQNNYFGTDSTGLIGIGNHWAGVSINNGSSNNDIIDNIISDNRNEGIWLYNGSNNNEFYRNKIGLAADGSPLGNWDYSVMVDVFTNDNIFGGSQANANTIAHTRGERPGADGDGITINTFAGNNNTITFNNIYCNLGKGIVRVGTTSNENQGEPGIVTSTANTITGVGDNGRTIHIYRNDASGSGCDCEAGTYIGSTTVIGTSWSFTHNLGLSQTDADKLTATQTTANGSTSEIAPCIAKLLLPVELVTFSGSLQNDGTVKLHWVTSNEINNDFFRVQRSDDGITWQNIGTVDGAGNSTTLLTYSFTDPSIRHGQAQLYYRLEQVDFNGATKLSNVVVISLNNPNNREFLIYPNPTKDKFHILGIKPRSEYLTMYNSLGVKVSHLLTLETLDDHHTLVDVSRLPSGTYVLVTATHTHRIVKQ